MAPELNGTGNGHSEAGEPVLTAEQMKVIFENMTLDDMTRLLSDSAKIEAAVRRKIKEPAEQERILQLLPRVQGEWLAGWYAALNKGGSDAQIETMRAEYAGLVEQIRGLRHDVHELKNGRVIVHNGARQKRKTTVVVPEADTTPPIADKTKEQQLDEYEQEIVAAKQFTLEERAKRIADQDNVLEAELSRREGEEGEYAHHIPGGPAAAPAADAHAPAADAHAPAADAAHHPPTGGAAHDHDDHDDHGGDDHGHGGGHGHGHGGLRFPGASAHYGHSHDHAPHKPKHKNRILEIYGFYGDDDHGTHADSSHGHAKKHAA